MLLALLLGGVVAPADGASIFDSDPVDPATGRPYAILPGMPLILPQPDGKFDPPIVVPAVVGDVDLVVRAAHLGVGPLMPPPVGAPPVAVAGGVHLVPGSEIPFTVIASDGGPGLGIPLGGTSLDGIPVVVVAFADLDGDGVVGPTPHDGVLDDGREEQEAVFPVGRQVAVFSGGVAEGSVAVWKAAPASRGGLGILLTAMAYVGPFRPTFLSGNVPDGPGVATLLPMFPRLDPRRVIDGEGRGGPADPDERLGFELEPAFPVPVQDPVLGTPFAIPLDGTSPTIDRARSVAGPVSRVRFLQPAGLGGFSDDVEAPLRPAGSGTLLEPVPSITVADDGPGGGVAVRLYAVDRLDNVTDPTGQAVTVFAGTGLVIVDPDTDGDPSREDVLLTSAAGVPLVIDDAGGPGDGGARATLTAAMNGVPVESLEVVLGSDGGRTRPIVRAVAIEGRPALVRGCSGRRLLAAVVEAGSGGPPAVSATVSVNGLETTRLPLTPIAPPAALGLPQGPTYGKRVLLQPAARGLVEIVITATDSAGFATPASIVLPVVDALPPTVYAPTLDVDRVAAGRRLRARATVRVIDECPLRSVRLEADLGKGFRRAGRLRDSGRGGDALAGDGLFTGTLRLRAPRPGTVPVRGVARNRAGLAAEGPPILLSVE